MNSNNQKYEAFKYFLSIVSTKKRYSEIDGFFVIIFRYVSENQKVSDKKRSPAYEGRGEA